MFTKQRFSWATTVVAASLAAACNGPLDSASPTGPSASSRSAASSSTSASNSQSGLTAAQTAALQTVCGIGRGNGGAPPTGSPPPDAITGGPGGLGPGDRVTNGTPPSRPPSGSQLATGGSVEALSGSCPALSFSIKGTTVRTNSSTAFGGGLSCAALTGGQQVGAMGTAQSDGSIVASCVAGL